MSTYHADVQMLTVQYRLPCLPRHRRLWSLLAHLRLHHEAHRTGEDWILLWRDKLSLHNVEFAGTTAWRNHRGSDDMAVDILHEVRRLICPLA